MKSNNKKSNLFESLDFLYVPAPDIESTIGYYTGVLGCKLLWKFMHLGCGWVACIRVLDSGPFLLLADHIKKNDMIMVYRGNGKFIIKVNTTIEAFVFLFRVLIKPVREISLRLTMFLMFMIEHWVVYIFFIIINLLLKL